MGATRRALLTVVIVALAAGCELVAGIQDIVLTGDAGSGGATTSGDAGGDIGSASSPDAPGGGDTTVAMDGADGTETSGFEVGSGGDAGAPSDTGSVDSRTDADAPGMEAGLVTELIDNMEANSGLIPKLNGRDGEWYAYNDGTDGGIQTPMPGGTLTDFMIAPPRGTSTHAVRTYGSGFKSWGVGIGFNINSPTSGPNIGKRLTYDASPYRGFMFYARTGTGSTATLNIVVPDHNTDSSGGVCTGCGDHFGTHVTLTPSWTQFIVYYTDLKQAGWGNPLPPALDAAQIYGANFLISSTPFDVWVDDIYFVLP